ncbi:regulator of G-protein signaling 21-like isoform X1 [Xyrichtys novacula]|uniref:Regulator of G-protein signaling 1 n=1 Tax=Xyrichtys novacula TaxID=13765 RepID=A0AAV1FKF6_XYRNO|nr:regulator of G-protein signaling 21-like isoform X1 [Xyrichtys novacula]
MTPVLVFHAVPCKCPVEDLQIKTQNERRADRAPVEDVVAWGESLDQLLECKTGQLVFEDFLRTEYSEENLLFWLACQEYKKITCEAEMMLAAKRIYTEFVQVDAPRQINIDCVTREEISENLSQPGPNCFDRAQRLIYVLMENDCYPRFLKSEIYQALLEQQ